MAGDWVKIEHALPDKPEVDVMAKTLTIDHDAVVGKCVRWFVWLDQQSRNGHAISVTDSFIDRLSYCPGFAAALREVGWLTGREGHLSIPNFDRHNGQTAKNRALSKDRQAKSRHDNVTETSRNKRDESVTREEKRREEITSTNVDVGKRKVFLPPTEQEVADYCRERKNGIDPETFIAHYAARGWKFKGGQMMKDWKAAVITFEKNAIKFGEVVPKKPPRICESEEQFREFQRLHGGD